eukprot:6947250-Lingulodinium_polyedra.AAC.1
MLCKLIVLPEHRAHPSNVGVSVITFTAMPAQRADRVACQQLAVPSPAAPKGHLKKQCSKLDSA